MASQIPFLNTETDCQHFNEMFSDSPIVRVGLDTFPGIRDKIPGNIAKWIDPAVDGIDPNPNDSWKSFIREFPGGESLMSDSFRKKPDKKIVDKFVESILDACNEYDPAWISVPQIPHADDAGSNALNRRLADATRQWCSKSKFRGKLITPAILTSKNQTLKKTGRNKKVKAILDSIARSGATGLWATEITLNDWEGRGTFERKRFPALIALHEEIRSARDFPDDCIVVAGPYWALNLVLWARGLIEYPAITMGTAWSYYLPGGFRRTPVTRIVIESLRRPVRCTEELGRWLEESLKSKTLSSDARKEFLRVRKNLSDYMRRPSVARQQISKSYRNWMDFVESTPAEGRAVALYQDFSTAYVQGSGLPPLPRTEPSREPSQVAETFMLHCL